MFAEMEFSPKKSHILIDKRAKTYEFYKFPPVYDFIIYCSLIKCVFLRLYFYYLVIVN